MKIICLNRSVWGIILFIELYYVDTSMSPLQLDKYNKVLYEILKLSYILVFVH